MLVDDETDVQAAGKELAFVVGQRVGHLGEPFERGLPAELAHDIVLGIGDDVRAPDRSTPLRHDGAHVRRAGEQHAHCAIVAQLVVQHEPVAARTLRGRRHPTDHLEARPVIAQPGEECLDRERERIGEQEQRVGPVAIIGAEPVRPPTHRGPIGGVHHLQPDRGHPCTEASGPGRECRHVFGFARAADHRGRGDPEEHPRLQQAPERTGDVVERTDEMGRREVHHEVGRLTVELLQQAAGHLTDRVRGNRMLRERRRVLAHEVSVSLMTPPRSRRRASGRAPR